MGDTKIYDMSGVILCCNVFGCARITTCSKKRIEIQKYI